MSDNPILGFFNTISPTHFIDSVVGGVEGAYNDLTGGAKASPAPDWLAQAASLIPVVGSVASWIQNSPTVRQAEGNTAAVAAGGVGAAVSADPTQVLTKPVVGLAHLAGLGQQGDQWDHGLIGLTGESFDKLGRLATFAALAGAPGNTQPGFNYLARSWQMAFSGGPHPINFGEAMFSDKSVLTDPDGLYKLRTQMAGTWGANMVSGVLNAAVYQAVDPTKGLAKVAEGTRASSYVLNAERGDELANTLNDNLQNAATNDATSLHVSPVAKAGNVVRGTVGAPLNDRAVVGHQFAGKAALDNVTDIQKIINHIDPMLGMGGAGPRASIPVVAELYADAAHFTSDVVLQRQIKLNVDYALTGSQSAMNWLVDNVPAIAAKGARATKAPSEFTLLEDALAAHTAAGGDLSKFDLGDWVQRHYADPVVQAEMGRYASAIEDIQKFQDTITRGGPEGGPVEFGTTGLGVQVAPRTLEKMKAAIQDRIGSEMNFQAGATGMTARVLDMTAVPSLNGHISIADPVLGARQLAGHLREYMDKVGTFGDGGSDEIKPIIDGFVKARQAERGDYVQALSQRMLAGQARKHGYDEDQVKDILSTDAHSVVAGRRFASDVAMEAANAGDSKVSLGDLTGTHTYLKTQHLLSHLQQTAPIWDFRSAEDTLRTFRPVGTVLTRGERIADREQAAADYGLQLLALYHTMWKHAQLGRVGLVSRVMMDTDLRANAMIGASELAMDGLKGATNYFRNHYRQTVGDVYDNAHSFMSTMQADTAAQAAQTIRDEMAAADAKLVTRSNQSYDAQNLALSLRSRMHDEFHHFHAKSAYYYEKSLRAEALAKRLAGDTYAKGQDFEPIPFGKRALIKADAQVRPSQEASVEALDAAQAHYEAGSTRKASITTEGRAHKAFGISEKFRPVQDDMEAATLPDDLRGSANGLSNLLLSNMDRGLYKQRVDFNNMSSSVPSTDVRWAEKYAHAVQWLKSSYTAKRLLVEHQAINEKTPTAVLKSFVTDPAVKNEFDKMTGGGSYADMLRWLSDITHSVRSMIQNDEEGSLQARLLQEKDLSPAEVEKLVPPNRRFMIYGPAIYKDTRKINLQRGMEKFYRAAVDLPDVYLARVPAYTGLYHRAIDDLFPPVAKRAQAEGRSLTVAEKQLIHTRAKQRAMNDVHRDMYDLSRTVGAHGVMRYIAPFFGPWYDVMTAWSRLIYDDPSRFGALLRYSQLPADFGMAINTRNNNTPVAPWSGVPLQDQAVQIPLFGLGGLKSFQLAWSSTNTIDQGNTPFSPGMGPIAQLSATGLVGWALPRLAPDLWKWMQANPKNEFSQIFFARPGDTPKATIKDLIASQVPSYMKSVSDSVLGEHGMGNIYINAWNVRYNDLIRQWREKHGGADPSQDELRLLQGQADSGARAAAITRGLISFGLGLSGNAVPEGQMYVDKMHALVANAAQLKQLGLTPEQVFAQFYPTAANLNWSMSVVDGHLEASVNAMTNYMKHRTLMDQHPDIQWWIAGPDNIVASLDPNNQFSQGAYNEQLTLGLRKRYSEDDLIKQDNIAMAQGKMDRFNAALNTYMQQNGIASLNDLNAGNLGALKQNYTNQLRAQYPDWATWRDTQDSPSGKRERMVNEIYDVLAHAPADIANRPDVELTRQYLNAREQVVALAQQEGIKNWETDSTLFDQRQALYEFGLSLAQRDVVFAQAWSRLFEGEFYHDIQSAKKQTILNGG